MEAPTQHTKAGDPMQLTRLCKAADSMEVTQCPAIYLDVNPAQMVGQGKRLDDETRAQLLHLGDDETGVAIPTETVLRASALFLAAHGRPDLAEGIESFVANWTGGRL
jgi:hypothetical protein